MKNLVHFAATLALATGIGVAVVTQQWLLALAGTILFLVNMAEFLGLKKLFEPIEPFES